MAGDDRSRSLDLDDDADAGQQGAGLAADGLQLVALLAKRRVGVEDLARLDVNVLLLVFRVEDILHVDVDAEHQLLEVESLVDPQVQLGEGIEPLAVEAAVVVEQLVVGVPRLDVAAPLHVVGRIGRAADDTELGAHVPVLGQRVGAAEGEHVLVVPRRGQVPSALPPVLELAPHPGVGGDEGQSLVVIPASHQLGAIGPARGGRGDRLVAQHAVVRPFRGERDAVFHRHGVIVVMFVETLGRELEVGARAVFQSGARLVASDVAEVVRPVHVVALVILEAQGGVGRQFIIATDAGIGVDIAEEPVGEREPGRELVEEVAHALRVVVGVRPEAERGGEPLVVALVDGRGVETPFPKPQIRIVEDGLGIGREDLLVGIVAVLRVIHVAAEVQLDERQADGVLRAELVLDLVGVVAERQIVGRALVVIPVFRVFVVGLASADDNTVIIVTGVVLVDRTQRIAFLLDDGQVGEDVLVLFREALLVAGVELHVVDRSEAKDGQLVLPVERVLHLELRIGEGRQEGQADQVEQELQVGAAQGDLVGGLVADRAVGGEAHLRGAEDAAQGEFLLVAIFQFEIEYGAERVALRGGKGGGVEVDLADEVGIQDADWPA